MAPKNESGGFSDKRVVTNRGAWTAKEDRMLSEYIEVHGPKRWKSIATKAGLNRCGKSCRLRWLNYLRPNIKRGNISHEEEDLILRLHKLLGNRWSLIAGRLPGRTDNEIKNYWNSHLSKKINAKEKTREQPTPPALDPAHPSKERIPELVLTEEERGGTLPSKERIPELVLTEEERGAMGDGSTGLDFEINNMFDFSLEGWYDLDWVNEFLQLNQNN